MTHWIRDALDAARTVRQVRKSGNTEKLALVEERELIENRHWLAQRDYENQLMQRVIQGTVNYESICNFCEERDACHKDQKGKRGCKDWWLRFLTPEEITVCAERADAPGAVREDKGHAEQ